VLVHKEVLNDLTQSQFLWVRSGFCGVGVLFEPKGPPGIVETLDFNQIAIGVTQEGVGDLELFITLWVLLKNSPFVFELRTHLFYVLGDPSDLVSTNLIPLLFVPVALHVRQIIKK
jgi:hypothetical protein